MYGVLRGHLPGRVKALFKIFVPELAELQQLALVRIMTVDVGGKADEAHGLVTVLERSSDDPRRDWAVN